jgi:hypothetical protein
VLRKSVAVEKVPALIVAAANTVSGSLGSTANPRIDDVGGAPPIATQVRPWSSLR